MFIPIGPAINAAAAIAGALLGKCLCTRMNENLKNGILTALGLGTVLIGLQMGLKTKSGILVLTILVCGACIGTILNLDNRIYLWGEKLKRLINLKDKCFSEGLVTSSIFFCMGAMSIIGSLDEALRGDLNMIYVKSIMDAIGALILSVSYGLSVVFGGVFIFLYQYILVFLAGFLQGIMSPEILNEISATGGMLITSIGLNLLHITKIPTANLVPSFFFVPILYPLFL